jgi:hypothetical protein
LVNQLVAGGIDSQTFQTRMQHLGYDSDSIASYLWEAGQKMRAELVKEEHQLVAIEKQRQAQIQAAAKVIRAEQAKAKHEASIVKHLHAAVEQADEMAAIADVTAEFSDRIATEKNPEAKAKLRDQLRSALTQIRGALKIKLAQEAAQVAALPPP